MRIQIGTATEQNRQPEPPARKSNEDFTTCRMASNKGILTAAVMDGIPVLRNERSEYPPPDYTGLHAATIAGMKLAWGQQYRLNCKAMMQYRFELANNGIKRANRERELYLKSPPNWVATVGCVLWITLKKREALFGWIGDTIAFLIPDGENPRLLGSDQLAPWVAHREKPGHRKIGGDGYAGAAREWQDTRVRNKKDARCWCGAKVQGWGALTGEPEAMGFVEIQTIHLPERGRIVLATDAFCVFAGKRGSRRSVAPYIAPLNLVSNMKPDEAAKELVQLTRSAEETENARSDDETFCVIDFDCFPEPDAPADRFLTALRTFFLQKTGLAHSAGAQKM